MARSRRYIDDLAYAEEHRHRLPELYKRIGHHLDMADRDWTEFCHHCKEPLVICEQVRDVGQDITDKATTVTRKLANRADIPAYLMAWQIRRPPECQTEIDELGRRILELQTQHPIVGFRVLELYPSPDSRKPKILTPNEYWEQVLLWHRDHHRECHKARVNGEREVKLQGLDAAKAKSKIWLPRQGRLFAPRTART